MVKVQGCGILVSEFELLWRYYYVHIRTNAPWERYIPTYSPSYVFNSTTTVFQEGWVWDLIP